MIDKLDIKPKVFDNATVNLNDLLNCKTMLDKSEEVLLQLNHILEDCNTDAKCMIKIAKYIKAWRKERRYWKNLFMVIKNVGVGGIRSLKKEVDNQNKMNYSFKKESQSNYEAIKCLL